MAERASDIRSITVGSATFEPGVNFHDVPVTIDLDDTAVALRTTVVVGDRPGPTMLLT